MPNILICIDSKPIKKVHKGWRVINPGGTLDDWVLQEIVENHYPHPDAPEQATIQVIEIEERKRFKWAEMDCAPLKLFINACENIEGYFPDIKSK